MLSSWMYWKWYIKGKKEEERKKPNINLWSVYMCISNKSQITVSCNIHVGMKEINVFFEKHAIEFSVGSLYDQEFINLKFR